MSFTIANTQHWPQIIPNATATSDGVMSASDKSKLDGLILDFYDQYFEGSYNGVPTALTEIFRFTPDLMGLLNGNLTVEYMIFSHNGGSATLRQTIVYTLAVTLSEDAQGAVTIIGGGTVNSIVTTDGTDIIISMAGADEDPPSVRIVAKCRISNGSTP